MLEVTTIEHIDRIIKEPFAWPGGYELFMVMDDMGALCWQCVRDNRQTIIDSMEEDIRDGWNPAALDHEGNVDGPVICDNCNRTIVEDKDEWIVRR